MRTLLLASAALMLAGGAAFAQNATGNPKSTAASNIDQANTHSELAPALPSPGATGSAEEYLHRADQALRANRTGEAQEALERAETRLLDRSTAPEAANQPDTNPRVDAVRKALMALGHRDRKGAMDAIQTAMSTPDQSGSTTSSAMPMPMPMPAAGTGAPTGGAVSAGPVIAPGSGGTPTSANGVAVNPMGGTNSPSGAQSAPGPLAQ